MFGIQEAADAIGYTVKGLRKIVDRSRAKARGARTRGPTIQFFQTTKGAPVKFRPEWVEDFIDNHTVDPRNGVAPQSKEPTKRDKQKSAFGFDAEFLDV